MSLTNMNTLMECECEELYSIEPSGDDYILYYGRCDHKHGFNLAYIKEPALNFDPDRIAWLLNVGQANE